MKGRYKNKNIFNYIFIKCTYFCAKFVSSFFRCILFQIYNNNLVSVYASPYTPYSKVMVVLYYRFVTSFVCCTVPLYSLYCQCQKFLAGVWGIAVPIFYNIFWKDWTGTAFFFFGSRQDSASKRIERKNTNKTWPKGLVTRP